MCVCLCGGWAWGNARFRTAALPTILSVSVYISARAIFVFTTTLQKCSPNRILCSAVCVFIGMAYGAVNCFPQERCNCRAGSKMGLTAVLLVAFLVALCAIRSTTLGPSRRYKNALRRNLDEGEVTTDGLLSPFSFSGSGDDEPSDCKTKGSTIVS